jgi:hypothetical protein
VPGQYTLGPKTRVFAIQDQAPHLVVIDPAAVIIFDRQLCLIRFTSHRQKPVYAFGSSDVSSPMYLATRIH